MMSPPDPAQTIALHDRTFRPYIPEAQLLARVQALGAQISTDYATDPPLLIAVLNGAFVFAADLMRSLAIPVEITFIRVASYQATQSKGEVEEILGLDKNLQGRHLIVVEDIVDTGLTMYEILRHLRTFRPASLAVATLLHKPEATRKPLDLRYVGFEIPDRFVVGYGLDYDGLGRNLRNLYQLAE